MVCRVPPLQARRAADLAAHPALLGSRTCDHGVASGVGHCGVASAAGD